jgi:hypothetical protein
VDDRRPAPRLVDVGPPTEAADRLHRELATAADVAGPGGIRRDRGHGDEGFEELLEAGSFPLGEGEEPGTI